MNSFDIAVTAPLLVGIFLLLFKDWLDNRKK
ncbi:type I toxin-antitoxin system Fst family toxin [Ligilactobacillus salivarius]|nr:type I toxin-antitoxin system Fst family toxin [Ligilactobacillus salivarius]MDW3024036.1 type I toxin-antitoxin system Fst family toxin [Ligilactobacillus salivarius]